LLLNLNSATQYKFKEIFLSDLEQCQTIAKNKFIDQLPLVDKKLKP